MKFMPKEMNDVRAELGNLAWFVYLNNVTEDVNNCIFKIATSNNFSSMHKSKTFRHLFTGL